LATEKLAWQAGTPSKSWQNFSFPHPPSFIKTSKIKPAPPKIMEMLLKKEIGTARFTPGAISFLRYPLASGPEGETLEGRKMAMAGTGVAVSGTGSMPTLLNDRKRLLLTQEGMASHSARKKYKQKGGAGSRRQASSLPFLPDLQAIIGFTGAVAI
jgi:hypothetical protein